MGIKPIKFNAHSFFCRKTMTGQCDSEDPWDRSIKGIKIPESFSDRSVFVEVVAKGDNVGKPCKVKSHRKDMQRPMHLPDVVDVGDILLCPNMHRGIQRSTEQDAFGRKDYEFIIEESVPWAIWRDGQILPLGRFVYIEMDDISESDGVSLPMMLEQKNEHARVLALGSGILYDNKPVPWDIEIDDLVVIPQFKGWKLQCEENKGADRRIIHAETIVYVLESSEHRRIA